MCFSLEVYPPSNQIREKWEQNEEKRDVIKNIKIGGMQIHFTIMHQENSGSKVKITSLVN